MLLSYLSALKCWENKRLRLSNRFRPPEFRCTSHSWSNQLIFFFKIWCISISPRSTIKIQTIEWCDLSGLLSEPVELYIIYLTSRNSGDGQNQGRSHQPGDEKKQGTLSVSILRACDSEAKQHMQGWRPVFILTAPGAQWRWPLPSNTQAKWGVPGSPQPAWAASLQPGTKLLWHEENRQRDKTKLSWKFSALRGQ